MTTQLDEIREFIFSQKDRLDIEPMVPLYQIERQFKSQGYTRSIGDDGDTNGWQVDFWYTFCHPEKPHYTVSGSLWYGDFKIERDEKNTTKES